MIIIFERTKQRTASVYRYVPNSLKVAYRVSEFIPPTGMNHQLCDYDLLLALLNFLPLHMR